MEPINRQTQQLASKQEVQKPKDQTVIAQQNVKSVGSPSQTNLDNIEDNLMDLIKEERTNSNNDSVEQQNDRLQTQSTNKSDKNRNNRTFVQILHEMFPVRNSVRYVEEGRSGPAHQLMFQIAVHVNGLVFRGIARTKQSARHEAAKNAIQYLRDQKNATGHQLSNDNKIRRNSANNRNQYRYMPYINRYQNNTYNSYDYNQFNNYTDYRYGLQSDQRQSLVDYAYEEQFRHDSDHNNDCRHEAQYESHYYDEPRIKDRQQLYYRQSRPLPPTNVYHYSSSSQPLVQAQHSMESLHSRSFNTSATESGFNSSVNKSCIDFTVDDYNDDNFIEFTERSGDKSDESIDDKFDEEQELIAKSLNNKRERIILRVMSETPVHQNPISVIHELHPDAKWEYVECENPSRKHSLIFKMKLQLPLASQSFIGSGRTKKLAKADAASKALLQMYNISISPQNSDNPECFTPKSTIQVAQEPLFLKQDIANRIGAAVMQKSSEVWDKLTDIKKWTVLSSIVLTDENDIDFYDVICITSGTKCVKGDSLSMNGFALNDCHAEVLARRCFLNYIYLQIEKIIENNFEDKPEFILERREDTYGFRLKKNIKVHLFISTAPCGDSRVFSPKEENEGDAHPNRMTRGVLRAKIEGGEGTIPVKRDAILTWDGILQGHQRLQFMSCSDKIALWNVVGIQGALLSHIIEPIYLESVVLGSLFNYEHLIRAIHGRLNLNFDSNSLKGLPNHFLLNWSKVAKCQLKEDFTRQLIKAPSYAINWIKNDDKPEVISCDSGRIHTEGSVSRLAKRSLFARFCSLLGRKTPTLPTCTLGPNIPVIYRDGKTASLDYQRAKTQCMQAFQEQNLGNWIQVPTEIDLFSL